MNPSPELIAEVRAWLLKAANDLRAAQALVEITPPLLDEVSFHCQQATEKALKGFLTWHGVRFRKTHNIEEIGEQCLKVDTSLKDLIDEAVPLTEYAWKFRYPGELFEPPAEEMEEAMVISRKVLDAVSERLPPEARP
jgi:HEPN domain-containing protein